MLRSVGTFTIGTVHNWPIRKRVVGRIFPLVAAMVVGCSRDFAGPKPSMVSIQRPVVATTDIIEPPVPPRYQVDADIPDNLKPQQSIRIAISVTALVSSKGTEIRLVIPQLRSVEAKKRHQIEAQTWTVDLDSGQTITRYAMLSFPSTGRYSVYAEAAYRGADKSRRLQDVASVPYDLNITSKAGTKRRAPGLVTTMMVECDPRAESCDGDPPPSDNITVYAHIAYGGPYMSSYLPLRRARVTWYSAGTSGTSQTNEYGYFPINCSPSAPSNASVRVDLVNQSDIIITETTPYIEFSLPMPSCIPAQVETYNWAESRVWDNMLRTVDGSRSYFQFSRPRLEVVVTDRFGSSRYRATSDFVAINHSDVWANWGVFVAAHEYGHAVQAATAFGFPGYSCETHYFNVPSDPTCAYAEGWADYHSVVAAPNENDYLYVFEGDFFRDDCGDVTACEARIAAIMLDLTDPINANDLDGPDNFALPHRELLDLIGNSAMRMEMRLEYGGETVSSYWQPPTDIIAIRNLLVQDYPKFVAPINGYELWWAGVSVAWPPLGQTQAAQFEERLWRQ